MKRELEKKFLVSDVGAFLAVLERRGIQLGEPIEQRDAIYFRTGKSFPDLPKGEPVLRIRQAGTVTTTTLKIYRNGVSDRTEVECRIDDPRAFDEYLRCLDFRKIVEVVKRRRKASVSGAKVVLDDVEQLGMFAEIEVVTDDDNVDKGYETLSQLAQTLGLNIGDAVNVPYDEMLYKKTSHTDAAE